jgi:pimeloyl-ACP methyl ester carboxylesterase
MSTATMPMQRVMLPGARCVSYERAGSGPPLVLVHGAFSDHQTNWEFVRPAWQERFTVYALARRGRGETDATEGHSLEEEAQDVFTLVEAIDEPVFLLGHSYGAHCALLTALRLPGRVRKMILYEPAWPSILSASTLVRLEDLAAVGAWDDLAVTFFHDTLFVPRQELDALRGTALWPPIVADARASLGDLRALHGYRFSPKPFGGVEIPVLLHVGSESPRDLYVTDALAAVLPSARIEALPGQAHEGMTTAPDMYARSVERFLLE